MKVAVPSAVGRALGTLRAVLRSSVPGRDTAWTSTMLVLCLSWMLLLHLHVSWTEQVERWASTNLVNLHGHPLTSLIASAFVSTDGDLFATVIFALASARLERSVGTVRALAIVAAGHVVATLVTEGGVGLAILGHVAASSDVSQLDIGVSYLAYTAVGAATGTLPSVGRRWARSGLVAWVALPVVQEHQLADWGHLTSVAIGILGWNWARSVHGEHRVLRATLRTGAEARRPALAVVMLGIAGVGLVWLSPGAAPALSSASSEAAQRTTHMITTHSHATRSVSRWAAHRQHVPRPALW